MTELTVVCRHPFNNWNYGLGVIVVELVGKWGELYPVSSGPFKKKKRNIRKKARKGHKHDPVSPLTGSGAPCFGGGLSGLCLPNYSL